jgi:hypothetical protein
MGWTVRIVGLALAASVATGASAQTSRQERLEAPRLVDWTIGFYRANEQQMIREEVPRGETVQDWKRMVTTQRFSLRVWPRTPAGYAREKLAQVTAACPGLRASRVSAVSVSGRAGARFRVDCPGYAGSQGRPETFFWVAVNGDNSTHVKQVAFRGGMGPTDVAWAERFLSGVALCKPDDLAPACAR